MHNLKNVLMSKDILILPFVQGPLYTTFSYGDSDRKFFFQPLQVVITFFGDYVRLRQLLRVRALLMIFLIFLFLFYI